MVMRDPSFPWFCMTNQRSAILMGVVVNAFGGAEREQALQGYLERIALRIEMARPKRP